MGLLWIRLRHLAGEDGKLRQGLQIIHSKIAILEDLSGQIDDQHQQINLVLESKTKQFEAKFEAANQLINQLNQTIAQVEEKNQFISEGLTPEVQIERETAIKYVKAAFLAHRGMQPGPLAELVGLGIEEASLIKTMNQDQLQFKVAELPDWMLPQLQPLLDGIDKDNYATASL